MEGYCGENCKLEAQRKSMSTCEMKKGILKTLVACFGKYSRNANLLVIAIRNGLNCVDEPESFRDMEDSRIVASLTMPYFNQPNLSVGDVFQAELSQIVLMLVFHVLT